MKSTTVEFTEQELRHFASAALRGSYWDLVEKAAQAAQSLGLPDPMEVYCENAELRKKVRDLGGQP